MIALGSVQIGFEYLPTVADFLGFYFTGGWGSSKNYLSNSMDTALALRALAACGYTDVAVIDPAFD